MAITQAEVLTEITANGPSSIPDMADILSSETATLVDVADVFEHCRALETSSDIKLSDDTPGVVRTWELV